MNRRRLNLIVLLLVLAVGAFFALLLWTRHTQTAQQDYGRALQSLKQTWSDQHDTGYMNSPP